MIASQVGSDVSDKDCTPDIATKPIDGDSDLIGESSASNGTECSPCQRFLPVLQKITDLTTKIQDLKKEHTVLSDQVKLTTNSFPDPSVLNTIQLLSMEHELLKKYLDESSERKRLYNEVIELKGNIRVFCRCIPLNQTEISIGSGFVVEFESSLDNELQVICSDSSKKQFKFDHLRTTKRLFLLRQSLLRLRCWMGVMSAFLHMDKLELARPL